MHHQIQVKFENGGHPQNVDLVMAPFLLRFCLNCGFQSITFEGMQQVHSDLIEVLSIIKYRSSSNLEAIRKFLTELWPFSS